MSDSPTGLSTLDGKVAGRPSSIKNITKKRIGWIITHDGKRYLIHRIICVLTCGISTEDVVDHKDGNPFNNRRDNIRVVTQEVNTRNRNMQANNSSGVTGVGFYVINKVLYCAASVKVNRKSLQKLFSVKKDGILPSMQMAVIWRDTMIASLGNFTERHGK